MKFNIIAIPNAIRFHKGLIGKQVAGLRPEREFNAAPDSLTTQ